MLWYETPLNTFEEGIRDAVCTRCEAFMGKCKCDYDYQCTGCSEKSRHDDLSFIVEAANRLLYKI